MPEIEYERIKRGAAFEVRALRRPGDELALAVDYLEKLESNKRKKLLKEITRFADHGPHPNREKFWKLRGHSNLFEIKSHQCRIMLFFSGPEIAVLTHGFTKKQDSTPTTEINRALRLRELYMQRSGQSS